MLWQPPPGEGGNAVEVDSVLTKWLRPHQRDGVQFMFECVMGMRQKSGAGDGLSAQAQLAACVRGLAGRPRGIKQSFCLLMALRDAM